MAISVTHTFVSAKPDDTDATLVRSSNWNAAHTMTMATGQLLGRGTAGTGAVEEITLGSGLAMTGTTLAATAATATTTAPQGRLTLQTAVPVMTATQSAKTTIYYTPYIGAMLPIYNGSSMVMTAFAELSVATSDTTKSPAAIGASKVNDWFVWNDAGTVRIGHGPDWTSDTARSAGTALVRVAGIWLNNVSITNGPAASRGTYVGTTRSNASSQLDWIVGGSNVAGWFSVWNAYNRVQVSSFILDTAGSWSYSTVAWRAANANTITRVTYIDGLGEESITASYTSLAAPTTSTGSPYVGVGIDTVTGFSGATGGHQQSGIPISIIGRYEGNPGIGFHYVQAVEIVNGASAVTFYSVGTASWISPGLHVTQRM